MRTIVLNIHIQTLSSTLPLNIFPYLTAIQKSNLCNIKLIPEKDPQGRILMFGPIVTKVAASPPAS